MNAIPITILEGWPSEAKDGLFDLTHSRNYFAWCPGPQRTPVTTYEQLMEESIYRLQANYSGRYGALLMERRSIFQKGKMVWRSKEEQEAPVLSGNKKREYYLFFYDPASMVEYSCSEIYSTQKEAESKAKKLSGTTDCECLVLGYFGCLSMY